jgi:hypothetical protein
LAIAGEKPAAGKRTIRRGSKELFHHTPHSLRKKLQMSWNWFHTLAQQEVSVKSEYL